MIKRNILIENIPSIIWGNPSEKVYVFVHGKMSNKNSAHNFAEIAESKGYQVISFDLPEHGDRKDIKYKCDIWNGIHDLKIIGNYVQNNWSKYCLFGCSLGAYFSLHAYNDFPFEKCLFQSPVLHMENLINNMFKWFNVTEDQLKEKKEIYTPIDTLSWDYYSYVKDHPIDKWPIKTEILYGSEDNLQSIDDINNFTSMFNCGLTISIGSEHPFSKEKDIEFITKWLTDKI